MSQNTFSKTVFIFAYYSYYDPVFQSAVLPYFENLYPDKSVRFVLLTFEQKKYAISQTEYLKIKNILLTDHNIIWHRTKWSSGRFKAIKKAVNFYWGMLFSTLLLIKYKAKIIYTEAFPGSIFAYYLAKIFHLPLVVHTYEPHSEYMVEAGVWEKGYWGAKLLKHYEYLVGQKAAVILTATNAMIERLKREGSSAIAYRVPSCVNTTLFHSSDYLRNQIRTSLGIGHDEYVITYLGKFGGMYMNEEIFDFFVACTQYLSYKLKFLIITPDSHSAIHEMLIKYNLSTNLFIIKTLDKSEVPAYLNASDFGFVPVKQTPSKIYCSPIKDGEYWACGVPILIFKGISDDYIFAEEQEMGIVIDSPDQSSYQRTIATMAKWIKTQKLHQVKENCIKFAQSDRSVTSYQKLYRNIFNSF